MGDIEPGYTVLVKKPSEVEVGQKLRMVGEFTLKGMKALMGDRKDERMVQVKSIGEKWVNTGFGNTPVPARVEGGLKFKLYRTAKKKGRTAKKKEGGARHRTQRRK